MEFIDLVFTRTPGGVTVGDSGLCCCVPYLWSAITSNKSEIRPEEQSEKAPTFHENLWEEIQLKGPQRQKQTPEQKKKKGVGKLG